MRIIFKHNFATEHAAYQRGRAYELPDADAAVLIEADVADAAPLADAPATAPTTQPAVAPTTKPAESVPRTRGGQAHSPTPRG